MNDFDITRKIRLIAESGATSGSPCPEHTLLAAYTEARLGGAEKTKLEAHLADCSFCLGQVGFLVREADNEIPAVPGQLLDAARGVRGRWFDRVPKPVLAPLAAAAALVMAVAVGLQLNLVSGPSEDSQPASDQTLESRTGTEKLRAVRNGLTGAPAPRIVSPEEGESLAESRAAVHWEASPGALHYTVQIVNLEGDVVWQERLAGLSAVVPPEKELEPGQRYFVWVEAQLQSGGSLKSTAVGFRIADRE